MTFIIITNMTGAEQEILDQLQPHLEPLGKAILDLLRIAVLALGVEIINFLLTYVAGIELDPTVKILLTLGLKSADRYLHELGKDLSTKKTESPLLKGIVRF